MCVCVFCFLLGWHWRWWFLTYHFPRLPFKDVWYFAVGRLETSTMHQKPDHFGLLIVSGAFVVVTELNVNFRIRVWIWSALIKGLHPALYAQWEFPNFYQWTEVNHEIHSYNSETRKMLGKISVSSIPFILFFSDQQPQDMIDLPLEQNR